jgi:hypothetical protein
MNHKVRKEGTMDTMKCSVPFEKNFASSVVFLVFPLCLCISVVYSSRFSLKAIY